MSLMTESWEALPSPTSYWKKEVGRPPAITQGQQNVEVVGQAGVDGWDADETLVEDQTQGFLEKAVLKIVDEFYE